MTIPQYQIPSSIFLTLMYLPIDLMGKAEKKKKAQFFLIIYQFSKS